jgi:hypothetical protein
MATENAGWGAPKIHGEILALGFMVSERTVSRCLVAQAQRPDAIFSAQVVSTVKSFGIEPTSAGSAACAASFSITSSSGTSGISDGYSPTT